MQKESSSKPPDNQPGRLTAKLSSCASSPDRKRRRAMGLPDAIESAAPALRTALLAGVGCALRVVLEVSNAVLSTLLSGFRCPLGIFGEIPFANAMFGHFCSPVSFRS